MTCMDFLMDSDVSDLSLKLALEDEAALKVSKGVDVRSANLRGQLGARARCGIHSRHRRSEVYETATYEFSCSHRSIVTRLRLAPAVWSGTAFIPSPPSKIWRPMTWST